MGMISSDLDHVGRVFSILSSVERVVLPLDWK